MARQTTVTTRPRGGTIFTALITIGIMSMAVLAMLQYSIYQNKMTVRRVEREAVYYTAEAGVDQVVHYFNFPAEYTDNTTFFTKDTGTKSYYLDVDSDGFADMNVFEARMVSGFRTLVDTSTSPNPLTFSYDSGDTTNRAQVTDLTVSLPDMTDPETPADAIMVVTSQAENVDGQTRIVRALLGSEPPFVLKLPAAIISLTGAGTAGQANVHWGEGWFQTQFQLPNGGLNNITSLSDDPWAIFRVVNEILMSSGKYADGSSNGSTTPLVLPGDDPYYYVPWTDSAGHPTSDYTNLLQNQDSASIDWPAPLEYDFWKNAAQTRGYYFSWNATGNALINGESGQQLAPDEFLALINQASEVVLGVDGASQVLPDPTIVFVDTLDGNPPNGIPAGDPGSNLCNLGMSGGGDVYLRGVFYVAGDVNVNVNGVDNMWLQDPDYVAGNLGGAEEQVDNVWLNGALFCDGVMTVAGNSVVYGSLFAELGFGAGGTPDVWYDYRLASGFPFSFNSNVTVLRLEELHPDISGI